MFSVIIPVYNGEKVIETAVNSVLCQTFDKWEIIIVNDGSTDRTAEILKKYEENEKISVYTQKNSGVSAARNLCIKHAKYDYIALLDADDFWRENHLEVLKEMIETYSDAGLYCTFKETELLNGKKIETCHFFETHPETTYLKDFFEAYAEDKSAKAYNASSTCFTKAAAFKAGGFPENCKIGEDLEFALKISAYYPVVLSAKSTAVYCKENSTATKNVSFDPDWHFFKEVEKLYADSEIPEKKKENIRRVMDWFEIRRCRHYVIDGRKKEAVSAFFKLRRRKELFRERLSTLILLFLPCALVKKIFLIRWRSQA